MESFSVKVLMAAVAMAAAAIQLVHANDVFNTKLGIAVTAAIKKAMNKPETWSASSDHPFRYWCNGLSSPTFGSVYELDWFVDEKLHYWVAHRPRIGADLAHAQAVCTRENLNAWYPPGVQERMNEEGCKEHVRTTLSNVKLCGGNEGGIIRDLDEIKALFVPTSVYESLGEAFRTKAAHSGSGRP